MFLTNMFDVITVLRHVNVRIDICDTANNLLMRVTVWDHWPLRAVRMGAMSGKYVPFIGIVHAK